MKKYRVDYVEKVECRIPNVQTIVYAYEDDSKTMADAVTEFYETHDVNNIESITFSGVRDAD